MLLFHLQQAVEKFLKSLLSLQHIKFPKIHDVEKLIELCEEGGITLPEYIEEFVNLTPYAVELSWRVAHVTAGQITFDFSLWPSGH